MTASTSGPSVNISMLDADGQPTVVAGVPPDYFSAQGQRWGNPLYRWERMQADGFRWWIARMTTEFRRFDLLRVDHFRGFEACWEIPATDDTAVNGRWVKVAGRGVVRSPDDAFRQRCRWWPRISA